MTSDYALREPAFTGDLLCPNCGCRLNMTLRRVTKNADQSQSREAPPSPAALTARDLAAAKRAQQTARQSGQVAAHQDVARARNAGNVCPDHNVALPSKKVPGGLYCSKKSADGAYCKWHGEAA